MLKERLHPGKMLLVDTRAGKIIQDEEIKSHYAGRKPYGEWLDGGLVRLEDLKIPNRSVPCTRRSRGPGCRRPSAILTRSTAPPSGDGLKRS